MEQLSPWLDAAGARPDPSLADWILVSLTLGIVGLPNVGKSTMFNALTRNDVLAANYPFATIEPNVGVVPLRDPRLDRLAEMFSLGEGGPGDGVVRRHRRHRRGRQRGRRAGQQVPRQHPRGRRDLPGRARLRRRRRRARRRPRRPGRGHRDDRDRARPRRPPDARQGPAAPREGGAGQEGDQGRRRRGPARAERAERGPHPLLRRPRLAAAARAEPHDGQAVPLRLQRRRAGAHRRREAQGARRARRPGRGRVPRREGRAGAARARRRVGRRSCWSRSVSPSRVSTRWPAPASAPSVCRPTSPRAPRSRAPGRSGSAPPPPRPPA